ncbi:hypothetical protein DTK66_03700 [Lactobacillus sp. M31]|uniref:Uncharacterized protein n=1 Tax=Limosilactobacillus walteri TaxID=2268022 RepID=A0ABR8P659_9LACO|nr:hypothetical protein [Limosilactobacillus walteri]
MLFHPKSRIYYPPISMRGIRQMPDKFPWSLFEKSFAKTLYVGPVPHPALAVGHPENKINLFPETAKV